jgi:signal transduction histidine kinase
MEMVSRSIFEASKQLVSASDEKDIVQILLQLSLDLSGAAGASFVPLDERGLPLAAIRQGDIPESIPNAWLEYLASPSVRIKCSQCSHYGRIKESCQLLEGPFAESTGVYCLPVRYADHDLGILNIFMPAPSIQSSEVTEPLQYLIDIAALAIANDRLKRRELAMFDQFRSLRKQDKFFFSEDQTTSSCIEDRLVEVEYKAQIEERTRLAREIHDGLAQTLGFLKLQAAQLIAHLEKNNPDRLSQISHSLYRSLAEAYLDTREAINMLRVVPGELNEARFENWLRRLVEEYQENTDIQVSIREFSVDIGLPNEVHLQLIRIIQEALINVRKHAHAQHVQIYCREMDHALVIEIQDDGQGFFADEVLESSQYGMRGMRERANLIGAELQWISQPGSGTAVRLAIPLRDEWEENIE